MARVSLSLSLFLAVFAADVSAASPNRPVETVPSLTLDEQPETLVPKQSRSEAEQDRLEALAIFSAARLHEHRQDYAGALRLYQRAFRLDPQSATIARSIVPLAARLERHAEAVRYALKLVELEQADPELLKRLGVFLTETGRWQEALVLYEKALAARTDEKEGIAEVLLHMEMGRLYHALEKYKPAAEHFGRVLEALEHPDRYGLDGRAAKVLLDEPGPTYQLIGEAFVEAGQREKAVAAFEKSNKADPNKGRLAYNLALVDARAGHPDKALARLQSCFQERGAVVGLGLYRLLGEVLKALHKEQELVPRLEKLLAADPHNVLLAHFLAEQYLKAKQFDKAEPLFRAVVAKAPSVSGYRDMIEVYRSTKRYDGLLRALGEAASKTASIEPLAEKDRALGNDKELVSAVVELARGQLKRDPKGLPYDQRLAVALLTLDAKQFDVAREFFNLAIQSRPKDTGELLLTWGLGLLLKEQYPQAVEVFERGIDEKALPEDSPALHFYLAGALEMAGRTDDALPAARKAAELAIQREAKIKPSKDREVKQDGPRFLSRVAWILYHGKRSDEALKAYTDLLDKFDSDYSSPEVRQVVRESRLVLSNLALAKGDMPKAVEWLERVLDEFPDDPSALNDLGYLWADEGKHLRRAHRMIQKALEQEPDNAAYRDSLGWALFRLGRIPEAVIELEKAAAKEPDATVLDHLGDAFRAADQPAKAEDAWRRAAEAHRKAGAADKAKQVEAKIAGQAKKN